MNVGPVSGDGRAALRDPDWVLAAAPLPSDFRANSRYSRGLDGLHDRPRSSCLARLNKECQEALRKLALDGPDVKATGVSAWTLATLCREVERRWDVCFHEGHMGRIMRSLGLSWQKARPSHPKADPAARDAFAKGGCKRP